MGFNGKGMSTGKAPEFEKGFSSGKGLETGKGFTTIVAGTGTPSTPSPPNTLGRPAIPSQPC